jgi:drug/metabolite transporter (DMT)-like permease
VSGIILLVLIGLGAAWLFTRGRKRLSLPVTGKHWVAVIIVVVVLLALAYGATHTAHSSVP